MRRQFFFPTGISAQSADILGWTIFLKDSRFAMTTTTSLGGKPTAQPSKTLETFDNPNSDRDYVIRISTPEFTCLCPVTGQPDFATLTLEYIPEQKCVELKSFKLYLWSFRDEGAFHEAVTNEILDHLAKTLQPRFMRLTADFNVRGGVYTNVVAEHRAENWQPAPAVDLASPANGQPGTQ